MKNYISIIIVIIMAGITFTNKVNAQKAEKAESEVIAVLDNLHNYLITKEFKSYSALLSDDGLFCGTDSKEFWDKSSLLELQKQMFSNPDFQMEYKLTKRVVRVAEDGKSALAVEQFISPDMFSPHLPIRFTSHHVKTKKGWKIDFLGWSLVPDNEDLGKLAKALEK